jgi:prepilin-type processing-associated H-X9-DG protein
MNGLFAHGEPLASFERPAEQIMIGERAEGAPWDGYHPWPNSSSQDWGNLGAYTAGDGHNWFTEHLAKDRHNDGCNYGFADGHAKWLKWEATIQSPLPGMHNPDRSVPPVYGWE